MTEKQAFAKAVLPELNAAIGILAECGEFTATDVLRLARMPESNELRTIVVELAILRQVPIKSSGRGYRLNCQTLAD